MALQQAPSKPRFTQAALTPYLEASPWLADYLKQLKLSCTALPTSSEAVGEVQPIETPASSSTDPDKQAMHNNQVWREKA